MEQRNIAEEIKYQIKNGKVTVRLIILNVIVFLLINASEFLNSIIGFNIHLDSFLAFKTSLEGLFFQPWGLFTSLITHVHLDHLFFNMLFLFFAGGMFEQIFGAKKLVICYVLSGVLGNLFELVVSVLLPDFSPFHIVIGASGSIMGIFAAVAIYRPQTPIYLFGIVPIPIYVLALFFFANASSTSSKFFGSAFINSSTNGIRKKVYNKGVQQISPFPLNDSSASMYNTNGVKYLNDFNDFII